MKRKKIKIAVFDIDGTIFRSSLLIEYINGLVDAGIFPKKTLREIEKDHKAWLDRKDSYDKYIMSVVRVHQKYIKGAKVEDVKQVVKKVVNEHKDRNYRYTKKLIKDLKNKGFLLMTISGSPEHAVELFAKKLGFDLWFGKIYEVKNGRYTGNIVLDNSISKKDIVVDLWAKENNIDIEYNKSYAIGDSAGDISILTKVKHPIAFNPNSELLKIAKKRQWKIILERKDVVYSLVNFKTIKI